MCRKITALAMLGRIGDPEKLINARRAFTTTTKRGKSFPFTMIDPELLQLLVCPETHTPLHLAEKELLDRLNQSIASGAIKDRSGERLQVPLEAGLVREDGKLLYPIVDGIPVMLTDRAIELEGLAEGRSC
jgi:uncharacterized protein YbaR (Trm112 family)